MGSVELVAVRTESDAELVAGLVASFLSWLSARYPEMKDEIDAYMTGQNLLSDLDNLLVVFNPPDGECLLAFIDDEPVGLVMFKRFDDSTCEMNRMYVTDAARGQGVARQLCNRLTDRARALGFDSMLLTALDRHREALGLYRSLGFVETPDLVASRPHQICMTLDLT
jgi:GNAT superfamily N-acetyltransferase